jgi:hypothetical protein
VATKFFAPHSNPLVTLGDPEHIKVAYCNGGEPSSWVTIHVEPTTNRFTGQRGTRDVLYLAVHGDLNRQVVIRLASESFTNDRNVNRRQLHKRLVTG